MGGFARAGRGGFGVSKTQYLRYLAHTIYVTPLIMGVASAYVFAMVPQMQEIYLGLVEDADYGRGLAGLAAVSLFSALLYAWNHTEVTGRIDAIYPDHADIYFDRRVFDVRDLKTAFLASLPFFGLLIGLAQVYRHVLDAADTGFKSDALKSLPGLPDAIIGAGAATLLTYFAMLAFFYQFRKRTKCQKAFLYLCYALALLLIALPIFASETVLMASRFAGPLASTAFVLIELAVGARLSLWLMRKLLRLILAAPSAMLMVMDWLPLRARQAAIVMLPLIAVALISAGIILSGNSRVEQQEDFSARAGADLAPTFQAWLAERKTGSGRYPVFVVAAQGGGIYAASTAAAFLATMQDHCPAFARHIFGISAVSGGSVGASLFNAAFAESIERGTNRKAAVDVEPGCDSFFARQGELTRRLRKITQDDHISPVLAYLTPDFLGGLVSGGLWVSRRADRALGCGDSGWSGRDQILERSFMRSFRQWGPSRTGPSGAACSSQKDRDDPLLRPFSAGWSEKGDVPALILNATWVETGYRVAFSPFALGPLGGGTLYSFDNLYKKPADPPLIQAAVISARFPVLMPPWTFKLDKGSRLTFVDGGYADSSGTATALQLYNRLKELGGDQADIYMIVLTDKSKSLTAAAVVEPVGLKPMESWLYDFISPVTTLLSVRDLQSRKAVTEARTQLRDKMIVVQLDQASFPLPLGWKLSGLSSDIIRLTIGDPSRCVTAADRSDTAVSIANRNSCELKRIVDLLSPKTVSSQTLFPKLAPVAAPAPAAAPPKTLNAWAPAQ